MKINKSRKSTQSIMNHPDFSGVLMKKGGVELFIPKNLIFNDGRLKKMAIKLWERRLQEAAKLNKVV